MRNAPIHGGALHIRPALQRPGQPWPRDGWGPTSHLVAQIPEASTLVPGTLVIVWSADKPLLSGLRAALLLNKPRWAHIAPRCTALLARGYRRIGAGAHPRSGEVLAFAYAE